MKGDKTFGILMLIILIIMTIAMTFFFIGLLGTAVQEFSGMNHYWTEKGECFDKNSNKINEVTCDVKKVCSENQISLHPKCEEGRF